MKIIVFDTETTGLPPRGRCLIPEYKILEQWPYIVQLSFIIFDTKTKKISKEHDYIISIPEDIEISSRSIELHGITHKIAKYKGISMQSALEILSICLDDTAILVAHNIEFDIDMLKVEAYRNNHFNLILKLNDTKLIKYCTMENSVNICRIPSKKKYSARNNKNQQSTQISFKYPTLLELYNHLFKDNKIKQGELHNSFVDTTLCLQCFCKIAIDYDIEKTNKSFRSLLRPFIY
tara:strand:+ start:1442 stop:2146 length:705 start_codon:yes stop_codon:yes gene_type:complete